MTKRNRPAGSELESRLTAYQQNIQSQAAEGRSKRPDWSMYAAVAGSALAMASNASANSIITGAINKTLPDVLGAHTSVAGVGPADGVLRASVVEGFFKTHTQTRTKTKTHTSTHGGPGSTSSPGNPGHGSGTNIHTHTHTHVHTHTILREGPGIAVDSTKGGLGIAFDSARDNTTGRPITQGDFVAQHATFPRNGDVFLGAEWFVPGNSTPYLGWILVDFPGDIVSWAYNENAGESILAGQTSNDSIPNSTPEPSSAAMALLAAGAAGVLAWRRRRAAQAAAE